MRISDWSSDVCSSDLHRARDFDLGAVHPQRIDALVEQSRLDVLEVDAARLRAVRIVDARMSGDPLQRLEAQPMLVPLAGQCGVVTDGWPEDRQSVVEGTRLSVDVDIAGSSHIK